MFGFFAGSRSYSVFASLPSVFGSGELMPIVTHQFAYAPRPLRDGRFRVREEHTTDKGRVYFYPYKLVVKTDPVALQTYLDAAAVLAEARVRFRQAKAVNNAAGMIAALADIEAAKTALVEPRASLLVVATDEATTAMNARDWSNFLIRDELTDFEQHVLDGNTPGSFVWTDQTQTQGFRRFLRFFASTDDIERVTPLAPIVLGFSKAQIASNAGISVQNAQKVIDRANNLVSLNTAQNADTGERQDLEEEV